MRGKKPHDPQFDVREALYRATGVDLTAIEGIDAIHALTLVSELGTDFSKWPTVKHFTSWLGLCPQHRGSGGKIFKRRTRRGANRVARALRMGAQGCHGAKNALGQKHADGKAAEHLALPVEQPAPGRGGADRRDHQRQPGGSRHDPDRAPARQPAYRTCQCGV